MTAESQINKAPTHIAFHVREAGGKSFWDRIGVAWQHSDGKGFNIELNCVPIDGQVTLRVPSPPQHIAGEGHA